jgi:anaerobic selenocysteine-containing dehydrogenase
MWVLNMRINHYWNNLFDFVRRPFTLQRYPVNFIEISPDDAQSKGIESGDMLSIDSDRVINHLGEEVTGSFTAVAYVTDEVPNGVTCAYFQFPGSPANAVVPADTTLQPLNLRYQFKLGRGKITRIGPTELKDRMSFAPRNIV